MSLATDDWQSLIINLKAVTDFNWAFIFNVFRFSFTYCRNIVGMNVFLFYLNGFRRWKDVEFYTDIFMRVLSDSFSFVIIPKHVKIACGVL